MVSNFGSEVVIFYFYGLIVCNGVLEMIGIWIFYEGFLGVFGEEGFVEVDYFDFEEDGFVCFVVVN